MAKPTKSPWSWIPGNRYFARQSRLTQFAMMSAGASTQAVVRNLLLREEGPLSHPCEPIVLMHGFAGFREIELGSFEILDYFNGVRILLSQMGYRVYAPEIAPFNSPMDRAQDWLHEIERIRRETGAEKVHLVGHSQGGLDARVLIAPTNGAAQDTPNGPLMGLGYGPHVASLTTIGTPHCGQVLVDQLEESDPREREAMEGLLDFISIAARIFTCDPQDAVAAVKAMSREYMGEYFNPIIQEPSEVLCYAIAGDPGSRKLVNPLMRSSYESLLEMGPEEGGGPNDGFVTLESALFGNIPEAYVADEGESLRYTEEPRPSWQVLGVVSADHIAEVGIPLQFPANEEYDHLACFAGLAQFLDPGYVAEMKLERSGRWARRLKSAPPRAGGRTKTRAKR